MLFTYLLKKVNDMDWGREPFSKFFRGVVLQTLEGKIFVIGSLLCEFFAIFMWAFPDFVGFFLNNVNGLPILFFAVYPIFLFMYFVRYGLGHNFQSRGDTVVMMFIFAILPFCFVFGEPIIKMLFGK